MYLKSSPILDFGLYLPERALLPNYVPNEFVPEDDGYLNRILLFAKVSRRVGFSEVSGN